MTYKNWYQQHLEGTGFGDKIADRVVQGMGSWAFIIIQTIIVTAWIFGNGYFLIVHFDKYPFILLNLVFSTQAAYASPLILMAANRQADRDKVQAEHQYNHQEKELLLNTRLTEDIHKLAQEIHALLSKDTTVSLDLGKVSAKVEEKIN
jgi:uncharacterized membrane protein